MGRELFFNFSTPRALLLTLLIPKVRDARWSLMLHHGRLAAQNALMRRAVRLALTRFDEIKSLSKSQTAFYRALNVQSERIVAGSSYCEPADHLDDPDALHEFTRIKDTHRKLMVMSGFPQPALQL